MLVRLRKPIVANKKTICVGDEATVSRIHRPSYPIHYKGMVERLEMMGSRLRKASSFIHTFDFNFRHDGWNIQISDTSHPICHLSKFFSMRFAKAVFPENFANCKEIWFSRGIPQSVATYSDFVRDENGVIERREESMRRFYEILEKGGKEEALEFKIRSNEDERKRNPAIAGLIKEFSAAGIRINHPEANYHVEKGRTVFFEINGLDLEKAIAISNLSPSRLEALEMLSIILSQFIFLEAMRLDRECRAGMRDADGAKFVLSRSQPFLDAGLRDIHMTVWALLRQNDTWTRDMMSLLERTNALYEIVTGGYWHLKSGARPRDGCYGSGALDAPSMGNITRLFLDSFER